MFRFSLNTCFTSVNIWSILLFPRKGVWFTRVILFLQITKKHLAAFRAGKFTAFKMGPPNNHITVVFVRPTQWTTLQYNPTPVAHTATVRRNDFTEFWPYCRGNNRTARRSTPKCLLSLTSTPILDGIYPFITYRKHKRSEQSIPHSRLGPSCGKEGPETTSLKLGIIQNHSKSPHVRNSNERGDSWLPSNVKLFYSALLILFCLFISLFMVRKRHGVPRRLKILQGFRTSRETHGEQSRTCEFHAKIPSW